MAEIKIGTSTIKDVYIGTSKVKKIYLGTTLVYIETLTAFFSLGEGIQEVDWSYTREDGTLAGDILHSSGSVQVEKGKVLHYRVIVKSGYNSVPSDEVTMLYNSTVTLSTTLKTFTVKLQDEKGNTYSYNNIPYGTEVGVASGSKVYVGSKSISWAGSSRDNIGPYSFSAISTSAYKITNGDPVTVYISTTRNYSYACNAFSKYNITSNSITVSGSSMTVTLTLKGTSYSAGGSIYSGPNIDNLNMVIGASGIIKSNNLSYASSVSGPLISAPGVNAAVVYYYGEVYIASVASISTGIYAARKCITWAKSSNSSFVSVIKTSAADSGKEDFVYYIF